MAKTKNAGEKERLPGKHPVLWFKRGRGRPPKAVRPLPEAIRCLESMSQDGYVSPNQAGYALGCTGEAVKQWIYQRRMPASKLRNGYWRIKVEELIAYVRSRTSAGPLRIVLVDADPKAGAQIQKVLAGHDCRCIVAYNLVDALLKAADANASLFIANTASPGIDCQKLVARIRRTKGLSAIPILFLGSKTATAKAEHRAVEIGAAGFLRWPASADLLMKEIGRILGGGL